MIYLREASITDIPLIQQLTNQIWPATYQHIISSEQIAYMLDMMYSTTSLEKQLENPNLYFYIIEIDGEPKGYTSCEIHIEPQTAKIHKLYLSQTLHGLGYGRMVVEQLEKIVAKHNNKYLILNVNR
ncbi:MAG TPA: GNAT family N-acetyltransferase, partial [Taishania sp.]|nr:GNAT family N-acetyltransferase [Taishania sp.]